MVKRAGTSLLFMALYFPSCLLVIPAWIVNLPVDLTVKAFLSVMVICLAVLDITSLITFKRAYEMPTLSSRVTLSFTSTRKYSREVMVYIAAFVLPFTIPTGSLLVMGLMMAWAFVNGMLYVKKYTACVNPFMFIAGVMPWKTVLDTGEEVVVLVSTGHRPENGTFAVDTKARCIVQVF